MRKFFLSELKINIASLETLALSVKQEYKKRPNNKGPTAAPRGLDVVTVPRLSNQVEGKCQKYSRNRLYC